LIAGEENLHKELHNGINKHEILADITSYFRITLKDLKPPGKLVFTGLDKGCSIQVYGSYNNSRPDASGNDAHLFIGYISDPKPMFEFTANVATRNPHFTHKEFLIAINGDKDCNVKMQLQTKLEYQRGAPIALKLPQGNSFTNPELSKVTETLKNLVMKKAAPKELTGNAIKDFDFVPGSNRDKRI
jgi:hypothetical protein